MAKRTTISYADHTWTGIRGCKHATLPNGTPHSGCDNCFAEAQAKRNPATLGTWGEGGTRVRGADSYWKLPGKWDEQHARDGTKGRVLWDLGDLFEDWQGPILDHRGSPLWHCGHDDDREYDAVTMSDIRRDAFGLFDQTPNLIWMVPTKRPWNVREMWPEDNFVHGLDGACRDNVWLGVSVSDQQSAGALIPELLKLHGLTPMLFVSIEPLLGPIDLTGIATNMTWPGKREPAKQDVLSGFSYSRRKRLELNGIVEERGETPFCDTTHDPRVGWVIVGGESGPRHRPCEIEWIQSIAAQCRKADVPCFVKQDAAPKSGQQGRIPDDTWSIKEIPAIPA